jgi:hypothetical protein
LINGWVEAGEVLQTGDFKKSGLGRVSEGLILPDISSIFMIIGYRLLFYAPNRVLCLLYHAKRLILGIKEE